MFLRNFVLVVYAMVWIALLVGIIFIGPALNIAGTISMGWALALMFFSIALVVTAVLTYGVRVANHFGKVLSK